MQLYTKILIGMAVGVLLGFLVGPNTVVLPAPHANKGWKPSDQWPVIRGL